VNPLFPPPWGEYKITSTEVGGAQFRAEINTAGFDRNRWLLSIRIDGCNRRNPQPGGERTMSPTLSTDAREKLIAAASASERHLQTELHRGGFAVALSGGGHRATLAAIGTLLALVDRRLNRQVLQIASISGGSITNAVVAQRCAFEALEPGELDDIAAEVCTRVVERGVLTHGWIWGVLLGAAGSGVTVGLLLARTGFSGAWAALAATLGIAAAFSTLMMCGHLIEWLLDRAYFRPANRPGEGSGRARMSSLSGRAVDHVFGTTDLVLGQPVHISSCMGGMAFRRLGRTLDPAFHTPPFQTFGAGHWTIAAVVRASAGFPGIPPRRMLMPRDPRVPASASAPRVAFLADGGIWNNLGSHILRDDQFIGSHCAFEDGVPRPYGAAPNMPLLVMNGSQLQRPSKPALFYIPGVALLVAFLQTLIVLNANTVEPRVDQMVRTHKRRIWAAERPQGLDPVNLVVDLRKPGDVQSAYGEVHSEEIIRGTDPAFRKWRDYLSSLALLAAKAAAEGRTNDIDLIACVERNPEPEGSYPVPGFANIEHWDRLLFSQEWAQLVTLEGAGSVDAPTTLDRIESSLARSIVARAYINTFLVSLYLAPLGDDDIERLASLPERLDRFVPGSGHAKEPLAATPRANHKA
jgi:hypothetical protein